MERKEQANFQEKKSFKFELKKMTDDGQFEGYAAVFGIVDLGGDMIEKGAFKKTIRDNKGVFPMTWYHDVRDPIGGVKVKEDDHGLFVTGQLNLQVQSAREKYELMKQEFPGPVIKALSFGYDTIIQEMDESGKKRVRKLKELKLYEVAPVLFAMQPQAEILDVKMEGKPYPNEHSCRLKDPGKYETCRRTSRKHDGKEYFILTCRIKGGTKWEEQAFRYPKDTWGVAEARAHCKDHDGTFEPASKSLEGVLSEIIGWQDVECKDCPPFLTPEQSGKVVKAIEILEALLVPVEPSKDTPEAGKSPFTSVIEGLKGSGKPREHLFGSTVEILKNKKQGEI